MRNTNTKYIVAIGVSILVLLSLFNFYLSLLFFFIIFQTVTIYGAINNIATYLKTKKGIYVKGEIKEVRDIESEENSSDKYEYQIEFAYPKSDNKYLILHRDNTLKPRKADYTIWINQSKIENSVVMESFNPYWIFTLFLFSIVVIGLFFADYYLAKEIFY